MAIRRKEGYSLLFLEIFIIFLNVVTITVIFRLRRKLNPDLLILTLAIADLLKALIPLNMTLVAYLGDKPMQEHSLDCKLFGWTAFTLNSSIMLVMTIMAIDRYLAICWPIRYRDLFPPKRLIFTIIGAFLFSAMYSALPSFNVVGKIRSYNNGSFCHFDFDSTDALNKGFSIFVLSLGFSMLAVVLFCYTNAMLSVRRLMDRTRRMSIRTRENMDRSQQETERLNRMFARLMIAMMVVFCVSWLLFLIVILQHVSGWFQIPSEAHFWSMRLAVINAVLNPIIGAAMCKSYRNGYKFIFCRIFHFCGLCTSCNVNDPWTNRRRSSASSPGLPQTPTTNVNDQWEMRSQPNDSGIEPDASIGYNQGTDMMPAYAPDAADGITRSTSGEQSDVRSRLEGRRISFIDEVGGGKTLSGKQAHYSEATVGPCGALKGELGEEVSHISHDIGERNTGRCDSYEATYQDMYPQVDKPRRRGEALTVASQTSFEEDCAVANESNLALDSPLIEDCLVDRDKRFALPGGSLGDHKNLNQGAKPSLKRKTGALKDHNCEGEQALQITHFPVDANFLKRTVPINDAAKSPNADVFLSKTEHSDSFLERTDVTLVNTLAKPFTNDFQVIKETYLLDSPISTAKQSKSNFVRTLSLEAALSRKPENSNYKALENATEIPKYTESDVPRSKDEIKPNSNSRVAGSVAFGHPVTSERSPSRRLGELFELTQKELEREVFC